MPRVLAYHAVDRLGWGQAGSWVVPDMTTHIALVPYQVSIDAALLTRVAAALQRQVRDHFGPLWQIDAAVSPFADWNSVPPDYVRLIVVDHLDSSALGVHADKNGQPY